MPKINWKRPVETFDGMRLKTVRPGLIKGLPADPENGRKPGEDMTWHYTDEGTGGMPFMPRIRNVREML